MARENTYHPLARPLSKVAINLLTDFHVTGQENVIEPPFVVTTNHMSYLDVPILIAYIKPPMVGIAKRKFQGTALGWVIEILTPVIFVEQASADRQAIRETLDALKSGKAIGLAPEGTRSRTGNLIKGFEGAAFFIRKSGVPILPAAITNSHLMLKRPRPKVTFTIGKPYHLPPKEKGANQLQADTERIMCAIAALMPEQYHGYYVGNPIIEEMRPLVT